MVMTVVVVVVIVVAPLAAVAAVVVVQLNSVRTITLVLFLKCSHSKGCRYSHNRE